MNQNKIIKTSEISIFEKILIGVSIIFTILGLIIIYVSILMFKNKEIFDNSFKINDEKFGNLGSLLSGTVGTIWSLVGVILFYLALRLQRKEISLQRIELELTRSELQGQKEQMIKQNETLIIQRFENTFFQLLTLHHQIVNSIDLRRQGTIIQQGRDVFKSKYLSLKNNLTEVIEIEQIEEIYLSFYKDNQTDFGHYFRNLYHILKFVNESEISSKEKYKYSTLIRAQLSSFELLIIFYNCISKNGNEKFKPLIESYHFFKNLPIAELAHNSHVKLYHRNAFDKK